MTHLTSLICGVDTVRIKEFTPLLLRLDKPSFNYLRREGTIAMKARDACSPKAPAADIVTIGYHVAGKHLGKYTNTRNQYQTRQSSVNAMCILQAPLHGVQRMSDLEVNA